MNDVEKLLNTLNNMEPISGKFRSHLSLFLSKQTKENHYTFLKPGQFAKKAWSVISGFIVTFGEYKNGTQTVMDIYGPGSLVTDLLSFIKKEPVTFKYMAIGKVELLALDRVDYFKLSDYPETAKLLQHICFTTLKANQAKLELHLLPQNAMMIRFFKDYNVFGLPDKYCASFLRIPLEKYIELKVLLLKSGEIELSAGNQQYTSHTHNMQTVYEVKSYLVDNYTNADIYNLSEIAALFNTTKKTLTIHFKKILGVTVHQLILKLRMEKAHTLLFINKTPVKEVYKLVGYKDVYHFSKVFKKTYGYSAKELILRPVP